MRSEAGITFLIIQDIRELLPQLLGLQVGGATDVQA